MSKTIHFNTGRLYTRFGQRITATWHDDGVITFMDHDRMIPGQLPVISNSMFVRKIDEKIIEQTVMDAYDRSNYENSLRAHQDGMVKGGCNVEYKGPQLTND